jgi:1,4-alpha-glucan branching enzyme
VRDIAGYGWHDAAWMAGARRDRNGRDAPISIYEVHLGSGAARTAGDRISYREAAESWSITPSTWASPISSSCRSANIPSTAPGAISRSACIAPTIRHGPPHEFRDLVDAAHRRGWA